jgi:hypothetical protein
MIEAQLKTAFIGDSYFHSQLAEITNVIAFLLTFVSIDFFLI